MAVTGHRPDKVGGYGDDAFHRLFVVARNELARLNPEEVITGMALGWDQAVAEAAGRLGIPYVAAVPCVGQDRIWPKESQARYNALLTRAKEVKVVTDGPYAAWKMIARNKWMVDNCDEVLALWDGFRGPNGEYVGGTGSCVEYATGKKKTIHNAWESWKASAASQ